MLLINQIEFSCRVHPYGQKYLQLPVPALQLSRFGCWLLSSPSSGPIKVSSPDWISYHTEVQPLSATDQCTEASPHTLLLCLPLSQLLKPVQCTIGNSVTGQDPSASVCLRIPLIWLTQIHSQVRAPFCLWQVRHFHPVFKDFLPAAV